MERVRKLCESEGKQFFYTDISEYTVRVDIAAMFLTSTAGDVIRVTKFEDMVFEENETLTWLVNNI